MKGTHCYPYPRPMVTVDAVVFRQTRERWEVLAVERGREPYAGSLALPGGFVEMDEELADAAKRELREETGLNGVRLHQLAAFGRPGRDPRGRNIAIAFVGIATKRTDRVAGGDDASMALWIPARRPGRLAFDHNEILRVGLRWLAGRSR